MNRDFWARRRPWWVVAGVATVVLTVVLLRMQSGATVAGILAVPLGVASLLATLRGLWPRRPLGEVARRLAMAVADGRREFRHQALAEDWPWTADLHSAFAALDHLPAPTR